MYIKSLMVHNFKSIDTVQIDFNPMTMIIGANATRKSNIINVFRFIEDIMTDGIENAIALQGGIQYIANANLSRGEPIEIQFTIDLKDGNHLAYKGAEMDIVNASSSQIEYIVKKGFN